MDTKIREHLGPEQPKAKCRSWEFVPMAFPLWNGWMEGPGGPRLYLTESLSSGAHFLARNTKRQMDNDNAG